MEILHSWMLEDKFLKWQYDPNLIYKVKAMPKKFPIRIFHIT